MKAYNNRNHVEFLVFPVKLNLIKSIKSPHEIFIPIRKYFNPFVKLLMVNVHIT